MRLSVYYLRGIWIHWLLVQIIEVTNFVMIVIIMLIYLVLLFLVKLLVLVHILVFVLLVFLIWNLAVLGLNCWALLRLIRISKSRMMWLNYGMLQALLRMSLFQLLLLLELLGNALNGFGLVNLKSVWTLLLNLNVEVAGFIAKKQLFRQEFSSTIQVAIMNLVEMSKKILEAHTEQAVGTVVDASWFNQSLLFWLVNRFPELMITSCSNTCIVDFFPRVSELDDSGYALIALHLHSCDLYRRYLTTV